MRIEKRKTILFINQSPNRMLNDIATIYRQHNWKTILLSGIEPPVAEGFEEVCLFTLYNRQSVLSRVKSWIQFTSEIKNYVRRFPDHFDRIFLVSNPPFLLHLAGFFKSHNKGVSVDLLVYDLYPDILTAYSGKWIAPLLFPLRQLNKKHFSSADHVYTPSTSLTKAVARYYNGEIYTVYNWVDIDLIKPISKEDNLFLRQNKLNLPITVLYSGNMGSTHDHETLSKAVKLYTNSRLAFLFIGHGAGMDKLRNEFADDTRFVFCEWQPEELFVHSIAAGDVALITYFPGAEGYSIPSKLPYYFATGTPVIMIGNPNSELAQLIVQKGLGWCVGNGDVAGLISLFDSINPEKLMEYRQRALQFVRSEWSLKNASKFYRP